MKEIIYDGKKLMSDGTWVTDGCFALLRTEWVKHYKTAHPAIDGGIKRRMNHRTLPTEKFLHVGGEYVSPTKICYYGVTTCVCCLANGDPIWINLAYMPLVHHYVARLVNKTTVSLQLEGKVVGAVASIERDAELIKFEKLLED